MRKLVRLIKCSIFARLYWRIVFRNVKNILKQIFVPRGIQLKLPIKTNKFFK